jgi:hypothetical protein
MVFHGLQGKDNAFFIILDNVAVIRDDVVVGNFLGSDRVAWSLRGTVMENDLALDSGREFLSGLQGVAENRLPKLVFLWMKKRRGRARVRVRRTSNEKKD